MNVNQELTHWDELHAQLYRERGYWAGHDLDYILRRSAKKFSGRIALIHDDEAISYQKLDERVSQLAYGFLQMGLQSQDKVVVQMPNSSAIVEVIFALFRIGAVPVYALPAHRLMEIEHFISISEAKAYITCDQFSGFDYRQLARDLCSKGIVKNVFVDGEAEEFVALNTLYADVSLEGMAFSDVDASSIALLQLSGGTTQVSKLIPRTHDDYFYSVRASAEICQLKPESVYLAALPVLHNFPHSSPGILGTLYAGGCVVMAHFSSPDLSFKLIERHRVTMTSLVPPLALVWMDAVTKTQHDLSSLQVIQVGGAKFGSEPARKLVQRFNCKLQQVFGMAEGLVNYTRLDDSDDIVFNTQGRPISAADEIRVVDAEDREVQSGVAGELLTRGPYTIRGYYRADEYNRQAFTEDGFYRTGDVVRVTEQQYLIVEGRVKDQINRGGEKVAAEEVENQLMAHDDIHDVAVVAMPDPFLGEKTCAFIVCKHPVIDRPRAHDLRQFLDTRGIAGFKIPDRFEFYQELPKTRLGKINKQALRNILSVNAQ